MSFKTSSNPVVMAPLVKSLLNALGTLPTAALLTPCKLELFNSNVQISKSTPLAALTPPVWTGYAPIAVASLTGPLNLDGNNDGMTAEGVFTCTAAPAASDLIYGYMVVDNAGAVLLIAERFDAPVPIVAAGDFVSVQLVIPEPFARSWAQ